MLKEWGDQTGLSPRQLYRYKAVISGNKQTLK